MTASPLSASVLPASPAVPQQRPCTRRSCLSTAVYRYTMAGTPWYRCRCGIEFPLSAATSA